MINKKSLFLIPLPSDKTLHHLASALVEVFRSSGQPVRKVPMTFAVTLITPLSPQASAIVFQTSGPLASVLSSSATELGYCLKVCTTLIDREYY